MNRVYRLLWSDSRKAFVPASEIACRRGKRSGGGRVSAVAGALLAGAASVAAFGAAATPTPANPPATIPATPPGALPSTHPASPAVAAAPLPVLPTALPTAPQVTVGQASVATAGRQMVVTESTTKAAINWNSFDIGSAAGVTFVQPSATSVVLNRVLSADPSQILGELTANGIVFLINPQGLLVGRGAEVNVGGLVASSLSLSDQDFVAGNWSFATPANANANANGGAGANSGADSIAATGAGTGTVSNAGSIRVTAGGFAALLGAKVENTGSISAKLGSVTLASGDRVTLGFDDSGLLNVSVDQAALHAMVRNGGAIVADGGRIILTAKTAGDILDAIVNNSGVLQSQSLGLKDGQVWLLASDPVTNTGANGPAANGGAVQGAAGGVLSSGLIDVSGQGAAGAGQATLAGTTVAMSGTIDASSAGSPSGVSGANAATDATGGAGRVLPARSWSGPMATRRHSVGSTAAASA